MTTKKKVYLASFLAPMLIMLVAWIIDGFFPFGAKSLMAVDFNTLVFMPISNIYF